MPAILTSSTCGVRAPLRILVVDDNAVLRAAVRGLLERLGHSVDVATNGREAVESVERESFDLVFLDVQMPEMGGFEAADRLRRGGLARGGGPRIIGVSGECEEPGAYTAAGMDDFLVKPLRLVDLVRAIDRHTRA